MYLLIIDRSASKLGLLIGKYIAAGTVAPRCKSVFGTVTSKGTRGRFLGAALPKLVLCMR